MYWYFNRNCTLNLYTVLVKYLNQVFYFSSTFLRLHSFFSNFMLKAQKAYVLEIQIYVVYIKYKEPRNIHQPIFICNNIVYVSESPKSVECQHSYRNADTNPRWILWISENICAFPHISDLHQWMLAAVNIHQYRYAPISTGAPFQTPWWIPKTVHTGDTFLKMEQQWFYCNNVKKRDLYNVPLFFTLLFVNIQVKINSHHILDIHCNIYITLRTV